MTDPLRAVLERATAGRYRVIRELGRGGMGAVFLAEDLSLDREVAIKVLPPDLAINPTLRERFVREAKLAASLSHPNIVHVHSVEEQGDLLAIVMQYVDGETLSQRIARSGPYDAQDCARLLQDTAWALGYAHARGIVHRDVKPDNLMIERGTGRALIMDFGIARNETASSLTEVGQSIGTPHYMSPEQAAAETVDGRSDLYSLGCVGFFAATGRTPFVADSAHRLLMLHLTQPAPAITDLRPEFPRPLADVLARLLSKDRTARFETGEALAEAINDLHLRTREVAPLLRLFYQQTAQSVQALLMIVVIFTVFWQFVPVADSALRAMTTILFGTMSVTIIIQTLERVRFVVRQGFTAPDVVTAVDDITSETSRAREQLLSDPVERARIRRRKSMAILGGFLGGISQPIALVWLSEYENGVRQVSLAGVAVLLAGTMCIGLAFALWAMRPIRITAAQRLAARLLKGASCRALFARAERRYARELQKAGAPSQKQMASLVLLAVLGLGAPLSAQQIVADSLPGLRLSWELVRVPGGEVTVPGANGPVQRRVESFLISRTEVPWELYDVFYLRLDVPRAERQQVDASARPSRPYGAPDRGFGHRGYATISLTHASAVRFAAWLSSRTGHTYAVASEAQWQRAADLAYANVPEDAYAEHAWYAANAEGMPHPIATRAPDRLGLFDLLGNVGEWATADDGTPILRGGSFLTRGADLAPTYRERQIPNWNQTDPQDPKSRWWLSDGPFAGLRLVRIP